MTQRASKPDERRTATHRAKMRLRCLLAYSAVVLAALSILGPATAQDVPNQSWSLELPEPIKAGPEKWTSPEGLSSTLQVMLTLTVLSLAPAVLLMTTCFVRIIVVLGLLRQVVHMCSLEGQGLVEVRGFKPLASARGLQ